MTKSSRTPVGKGRTPLLIREFSFDRRDFDRVRQLIYQRAGISLQPHKHAMVYSRLARRLRETGHNSFSSYLQWLESGTG
jgi:chemotaxis protein methyltransferase CheR